MVAERLTSIKLSSAEVLCFFSKIAGRPLFTRPGENICVIARIGKVESP
jgi:hypothetical protein